MVVQKAIIMAAGEGRRMKSHSSKPMTVVGNKRLIQYGMDALLENNISDITIIYSKFSEDLLMLKNDYPSIRFIKQEDIDGSLSTFCFIGKICQPPFLLLDCDIIFFKDDFSKMLHSIQQDSSVFGYFAIVSHPIPNSPKYIQLDNHLVITFDKKEFVNGYSGGMIYLWNQFPVEFAETFYQTNKSLGNFYHELVQKEKIAPMFIRQLWDIDTMEKEIYKILPDGNPSGLSLNQFIVFHNRYSKWNQLSGKEIYSRALIEEKFYRSFPKYQNDSHFDILTFMQQNDTNSQVIEIIDAIAEGLTNLLLSLQEGNKKCQDLNPNLTEEDWNFWKNCQKIVLDGKILEGSLGERIITKLSYHLNSSISIAKLSDFTEVKPPSLLGCAIGGKGLKQYVFDFGNTAVKRGIAFQKKDTIEIKELETIYHEDFWNLPNTIQTANMIDDFISNLIIKTLSEEETYQIGLCLANNIISNCIADRGSYCSLRFLGKNYNQYLTQKLRKILQKDVYLKIYNDAEAVGRIFSHDTPHMAIITLGTYLGIAYPPYKKL